MVRVILLKTTVIHFYTHDNFSEDASDDSTMTHSGKLMYSLSLSITSRNTSTCVLERTGSNMLTPMRNVPTGCSIRTSFLCLSAHRFTHSNQVCAHVLIKE